MHFLYVYWFIALTFHLKYVLFSLHLSIFPNSFFFTNMKHCTKYWTFNVAEPEPNFVLAPAPTFWLKKSCLHAGAGWRSRIRLQEMKNPGTDQQRLGSAIPQKSIFELLLKFKDRYWKIWYFVSLFLQFKAPSKVLTS